MSPHVVEPLMPDWPKVRFQTKRDTGVYAVCGRSRFFSRFRYASAHQTCLYKRTRDGVIPEENPTSLKETKLVSANGSGPISGQLQLKERAGFLSVEV